MFIYSVKPTEYMITTKKGFQILLIFFSLFFLNSCGVLKKPDWSNTGEPDGKKRARKNVEDGKGFTFGSGGSRGGGDFLFASSNPLWRASLEIIEFMPLSNADYAGGLIITDWYSEGNPDESVKITIKFLSNEIRVDSLNIDIRKKNCDKNNKCIVKKITNNLNFEIKDKILKKAAQYDAEIDTKAKKGKMKKKYPGSND